MLMSEYILSCESTIDLTRDEIENHYLRFIPFHLNIGADEYKDDLWQTIKPKDLYDRMEAGEMTRTSQVGVGEYIDFFESFLKEGKDVLHLCLSSGISGTFNSANSAANLLKEKYPDRKIYILDSLAASSGYGLLMTHLAGKKKEGLTIDALRDYAEEHKLNVQHWFFSTDLKYYVRGGRVTKAAGFFGNLFRICPLLNVDEHGKLVPREKIRTIKKAETAIVDKMVANCDDGEAYSGDCYISYSECLEYATAVKDRVEEKFPALKEKVRLFDIGAVIGCHTGPGTVALFFFGKKRIG